MKREEAMELVTVKLNKWSDWEHFRQVEETDTFRDLGMDSLDVVDMTVEIEKDLGIDLKEDTRIYSMQTVGDLLDVLGDH